MTKKKDSFNFNRVKKFLIHIFSIDKKLFKKKSANQMLVLASEWSQPAYFQALFGGGGEVC